MVVKEGFKVGMAEVEAREPIKRDEFVWFLDLSMLSLKRF
jgi:hypothetical protein